MKSANWKDIVEIIGIGAIVASLMLLAYEIRQTRIAIMGETYLTRAETSSDWHLTLATSDVIPGVLQNYRQGGLESLTPEEQTQLRAVAIAAKTRIDAYYYQYELGLLGEEWYRYRFVPSIRQWRDTWEEIGALSETNTRPGFLAAVRAMPD